MTDANETKSNDASTAGVSVSNRNDDVSMTFEEFRRVARQGDYNLVPIFRAVPADLETPVSAFLKLRRGANSFLLESVEGGEQQARYSFLGTEPYKVLRQSETDPLVAIEQELATFKVLPVRELPSFTGGGVGYVSYDCVRHFEPSVKIADKNALQLPESVFLFCSSLVAFDHVQHTAKVIVHCRLDANGDVSDVSDDAQLRVAYDKAVERLRQVSARLAGPIPPRRLVPKAVHHDDNDDDETKIGDEVDTELRSNHGKDGYEKFVVDLREHIKQGDIIQAVPSHRIARKLNHGVQAFDVYRQLRVINPSPYMFYFDLGDFEIVGASPEQLIKVDGNGRVTNHPIAGTRKRGATDEEDTRLAAELLANEKERAEHIMLVDLGRNDVGRVSEPGSVKVDSLMHIEKYSHVMHIVSHVSGQLAKGKSSYDAFRAVFPAGTVSGAPKVRAMQLVSALEQERRGVYAGAVGYVDFNGVMDTCISIRTMVVRNGTAYLQAGGGIVFDSEPEPEYVETVNKMKALARAIEAAEAARVAASEAELQFEAAAEAAEQPSRDIVMKNYPPGKVLSIPSKFGRFGGAYVPETLVGVLADLEKEYLNALNDPAFKQELRTLQKHYVGRPTPMYFAKRLTDHCGGARVWLKREDLAHTGAHKINNALGQGLLAKRMGKKRIIAETGAGQHGVATATACALLDLECIVYMGEEDIKRQALNVFRMKMLGAKVVPVTSGSRTLKDAVNEAIRDWVTNVRTTLYLIGSAIGPHPFPTIVRDFQCCLGEEARAQMLEMAGRLPDVAVACVGGGSNSIGLFHPFVEDATVKLVGVEAAGCGVETDKHSATLLGGRPGVLHGTKTYLLQDDNGQITETHSISAGLDYPGVGPEHAFLKDSGRAEYVPVTDKQALQGLQDMTRLEGIIPALEPSHAIYYGMQLASKMRADQDLLINLCGRGDKDMYQVAEALGVKLIDTDE